MEYDCNGKKIFGPLPIRQDFTYLSIVSIQVQFPAEIRHFLLRIRPIFPS